MAQYPRGTLSVPIPIPMTYQYHATCGSKVMGMAGTGSCQGVGQYLYLIILINDNYQTTLMRRFSEAWGGLWVGPEKRKKRKKRKWPRRRVVPWARGNQNQNKKNKQKRPGDKCLRPITLSLEFQILPIPWFSAVERLPWRGLERVVIGAGGPHSVPCAISVSIPYAVSCSTHTHRLSSLSSRPVPTRSSCGVLWWWPFFHRHLLLPIVQCSPSIL